jgi:hypothetical protein
MNMSECKDAGEDKEYAVFLLQYYITIIITVNKQNIHFKKRLEKL